MGIRFWRNRIHTGVIEMKRNIESNREKLAKEAVSQMDLKTMEQYIVDQFEEYYKTLSPKEFNDEWDSAIGE